MININLNIPNIFSMNKLANIVLNRIVRSIKDDNALPSGNVSYYTRHYKRRKEMGVASKDGGQVSTYTANVNMFLTGNLINSLGVDKVMETTATLKYGNEFDKVIKDNEARGRSIRTLSSENIKRVEEEFAQDIMQRLTNEFDAQTIIEVGELV